MNSTTEIKRSKTKTLKTVILCGLFVTAGIFIINASAEHAQPKASFMVAAGVLGILFFGLAGIFALSKVFDRRAGVIFTPEGFIDHSGYAGDRLVKWNEVKDIKTTKVVNQQFVSVLLNNPEDYIAGAKGLKKFLSARNYKSYETPVHISPVSLKADLATLHRTFIEYWNKYRS